MMAEAGGGGPPGGRPEAATSGGIVVALGGRYIGQRCVPLRRWMSLGEGYYGSNAFNLVENTIPYTHTTLLPPCGCCEVVRHFVSMCLNVSHFVSMCLNVS
jgi:hypothetical protein